MGQMDYYENDFETAMLKDTAAYYSRKASNWILDDSCPDYMLKVLFSKVVSFFFFQQAIWLLKVDLHMLINMINKAKNVNIVIVNYYLFSF